MSQCINKKRFDNEPSALRALELIRGNADAWLRDKVPRRVYACDICQGWHLTAMTEKGSGKKRTRR